MDARGSLESGGSAEQPTSLLQAEELTQEIVLQRRMFME
jgi:hypothetical protein